MRRELGLAATMGTALALAGAIVVAANWPGGEAQSEAAAEETRSTLTDAPRIVRNGRVQHMGDAAGALAARETGRSAGALAAQPQVRAPRGDDDDDDDD